MKKLMVLWLGCLPVLACGGTGTEDVQLGFGDEQAPQAPAALTVDHEASLTFQADFNEILGNPPVTAGGRLRLEYAPARLPQCRGRAGSAVGWKMAAKVQWLPDPTVKEQVLTASGTLLAATLAVPESATQVVLWFENTNDQGCRAADHNDNNSNYTWAVTLPVQATPVIFAGDWTQRTEGALVQGQPLSIVYDPARLRLCRATYNGGRTWNIFASWRFLPGGQTDTVALYGGNYYDGEGGILTPQVSIPADATGVQFWFSNSDRAGCVAWDSNFGNNHSFPVVPAGLASPAVGWAGDWDFAITNGSGEQHLGDADPAYFWDTMQGMPASSREEVQVWIPGITDQRYASLEEARSAAASRVKAQVVTNALGGTAEPATWGHQDLRMVRQQGNNFVYSFDFWRLRFVIYQDPIVAAGLWNFFTRFSTDNGGTWFTAGNTGGRTRRFVVGPQQDCTLFPDHAPQGCPQQRPVGWAGNWGGKFDHGCTLRDLANPVVATKSSLGNSCMTVTAEVYVAGLTDAGGDASAIRAEVETDVGYSGGPLSTMVTEPLSFDGRSGNNYRFAWGLSEHVGRAERGDYRYRFRFSADGGQSWKVVGLGETDAFRTLAIRNDSMDTTDVRFCDGIQRWESAFQHTPDCVSYQVSGNYAASNCEFFVNALGRGNWSAGPAHAHWLEEYITVAPQQGTLLNVGMYVHYRETAGGPIKEAFQLGNEISPSYYRTGFTYEQGSSSGTPLNAEVVDFASYVDVRRPEGTVVRLWLSNGGANYTVAGCFAVPGYVQSMGSGSVEYADNQVDLFAQKRSCQR